MVIAKEEISWNMVANCIEGAVGMTIGAIGGSSAERET